MAPVDYPSACEAAQKLAKHLGGQFSATYSGRGMYGKLCPSVVFTDKFTIAEECGAFGLKGAVYDNMGKSWVAYWPQYAISPDRLPKPKPTNYGMDL